MLGFLKLLGLLERDSNGSHVFLGHAFHTGGHGWESNCVAGWGGNESRR